MFMAGEHRDAMSRLGDLTATVPLNSIYCVVQVRTRALPRGEYHL